MWALRPRTALAGSLVLGYSLSPPSGVLIQRLRDFFEAPANRCQIIQMQFFRNRYNGAVVYRAP